MPALATNPAVFSRLPLRMVAQANRSLAERNDSSGLRSAKGVFGSSNTAALAVNFGSRDTDENFAPACVFRFVSRLCSVTASGLSDARRHGAALLLRLSDNFCATNAKRFSEPSGNAPLGTWESGPLARLRPV